MILQFLQLQHNLSASAIASCFGKVNGNKKLSGYKAEDMAASLLRNFTYLIAQVISWSVMEIELFHGIEEISLSSYKSFCEMSLWNNCWKFLFHKLMAVAAFTAKLPMHYVWHGHCLSYFLNFYGTLLPRWKN